MIGMSGDGCHRCRDKLTKCPVRNNIVLLQIPIKKLGVEPGAPILETSKGAGAVKISPRISGLQKFEAINFCCLTPSLWNFLPGSWEINTGFQRSDVYVWFPWGGSF